MIWDNGRIVYVFYVTTLPSGIGIFTVEKAENRALTYLINFTVNCLIAGFKICPKNRFHRDNFFRNTGNCLK